MAVLLLTLPLAAGTEVHGKPLRGLTPVPLARLVSSPGSYAGKTVRTGGRVSSVAANGAFTLEEGGKTLRVTWKDGAVALPGTAVGAAAAVEGVFSGVGEAPFLEATGAELTRSGGR